MPHLYCLHQSQQKMGGITKQGSRLIRFPLVEAANIAGRLDPDFCKEYSHRCHEKHFIVAKVAAEHKLAIRMYWIMRTPKPYPQASLIESSLKCILVSAS